MEDSFRPLFTAPPTFEDDQVTFHTYKKEVSAEAPVAVINDLISLCDGNRSIANVIEHTKDRWHPQSVKTLLETLYKHDVVVDGRYLSNYFWKTVKRPSPINPHSNNEGLDEFVEKAAEPHKQNPPCENCFSISKTKLQEQLQSREPVHSFSGKPISHQNLVDILWSAYGEAASTKERSRTVPSACGLFPLKIGLVLFKRTEQLSAGIYEVSFPEPNKVGFSLTSRDVMAARRSFVRPTRTIDAAGTIIVNGSFDVGGESHGNRSVLYASLEAGHVAQNIHLAASKTPVSTVEIGGFYEVLLEGLQNLSSSYKPLTTVVFGVKKETKERVFEQDNIEVKWPPPLTEEYQLPFSMALARMGDSDDERSWSSGKAPSPELAFRKAVSEAREWSACGNPPENFVCERFCNLDAAINPRSIVKFHPKQYKQDNFPLKVFDPDKLHSWIEGVNELTDEKLWVPADAVYYPNSLPKPLPRYMQASTSGVAAHPDRTQALKNSVLELIERDAFMATYLARLTQPTIEPQTLPLDLQKRISNLKELGFNVWLKDISFELSPVVLLYAQHKGRGVTLCSSCADFDSTKAVNHALMELEQSVLSVFKGWPNAKIKPEEVSSPHDHGALYASREHFQKSAFLVKGGKTKSVYQCGESASENWSQLISLLQEKKWSLVTVPLTVREELGGNNGLHIIRSIIPNLIPMMFGSQNLPCGMKRIHEVARRRGKTITYENMPQFPHPFA